MEKYLRKGILFVVLVVLLGCLKEPMEPEATVTLTSWDQEYYEILEEWSMVTVYIRVQNTGPVDIHTAKIWLKVTLSDGSTHEDDDYVFSIDKGHTKDSNCLIDVNGKEAIEVEITDYKLN